MSSPEVEKFEITDQDLLNEFNPNRPQYRQTKNKATYGIWAEDSDDDDRPAFGKKEKYNKEYVAPIGFVSGGVKIGDTVTRGGEDAIVDSDSENEYDRMIMAAAQAKRTKKSNVLQGAHGNASIGQWERHTRGVASKLMEKMGYVPGKGLGKNLSGISTPVEAKKRGGKGAVGFHGAERTERSLQDFPVKPNSDEEDEKQFRQKLQQWKKGQQPSEKKKKPRYIYKTADELLLEGSGPKQKPKGDRSQLSKVKVIDMTGKEQRVLSGYHAIAHKHDIPMDEPVSYSQTQEKKAFDMPELLHNLDLLVNMAEEEIIQNDRRLKYDEDMVVNLEHEKDKMIKLCDEEEKHINKMKKVLAILEECEERSKPDSNNPMTLSDYAEVFKHLQFTYYAEYDKYDLCDLAVALVFPLMKKDFEGWNVIRQPKHCLSSVKTWKDLIETSTSVRTTVPGDAQMSMYERLIWEVWMPHVRIAVGDHWSVREPESLLEMLEAWLAVIPEWVTNNILDQLVLPKLHSEVTNWNPLTDTMPIHAWIHPWLPYMDDRLHSLYAPIRHKLANALNNWHPSDPSAKMILQPWHGVFKKGHLDAFLLKNIVPKLELCMQEFNINPHQQHLDAWNWVMSWLDFIPHHAMVTLLQKNFFPRWLQVLCSWLSAMPNYNEVTKWYTGWKSMFPDQLSADPIVKEEFNKALGIMNRAVSGQSMPTHIAAPVREPVAYLSRTIPEVIIQQPVIQTIPVSASAPVNFRDLLERKAEEVGLLFMPIPNRTWEAKQVYKFGSTHIYLDRGVVFIMERDGLWVPVSLNTLMDRAIH